MNGLLEKKEDDGDESENFRAYFFLHIYSDKVFIDFAMINNVLACVSD